MNGQNGNAKEEDNMTASVLETDKDSERQRKLIEEVIELDRLRDENLSKQKTLRESISSELQELEAEFSNLTKQRFLKTEAFHQLVRKCGDYFAIGSRVTIPEFDLHGYPCNPVGVVAETWHNYVLITLEAGSAFYDDFEGKWIGPAHYLSPVEDHTEELTMPDDPHSPF